MEDRYQDNYRSRDRSPTASRYRDRSSERYRDRSRDRYRSSRYRDRSRSRSSSYSRSRRTDRYRSKSRSRSDRRSSRSRSPRRHHYSSSSSSRHYSSKSSRHHRRSRSNSSSSSPPRSRSSPHNDRIPPPPPSFPKLSEYDDNTNSDSLDPDTRPGNNAPAATATVSPVKEPAPYTYNGPVTDWTKVSSDTTANVYENEFDEPIDKERIHREMEEKLRLALAKEGKIYPPPKPEPSHPVFANDGSFLEIFKRMQQQMTPQASAGVAPTAGTDASAEQQKLRNLPICKRRGGKILKTGMVAKTRATDTSSVDPKDFWSIYLQEVKKYKNTSCDVDSKTRPLIK